MTEHKFTDEQIIKALECCKKLDYNFEECKQCPYGGKCYDGDVNFLQDIIDLIKRQRANLQEVITLNSKLEAKNAELQRLLDFYEETSGNKKAKAEAIKEFAKQIDEVLNKKRLEYRKYLDVEGVETINYARQIVMDKLKEMTEGK